MFEKALHKTEDDFLLALDGGRSPPIQKTMVQHTIMVGKITVLSVLNRCPVIFILGFVSLNFRCQPRRLVDSTFGIQFGGHIGSTN